MEIKILKSVAQELDGVPHELKINIYGVLERLGQGAKIPMPLCRSLSSIAKGLHELRFSSPAGEFRVFYFIKLKDAIYVIHAMQKKSQKIQPRVIRLLLSRIRSLS